MGGILFQWVGLPVVCLGVGFAAGWKGHDWRDAAGALQAERRVVRAVQAQGAINADAAQAEQAAQDRIVTVTRTITKEVPTYVTPGIDTRYPLPDGLVRVHDAAALGLDLSAVSNPAGQSDDAPSSVHASDLGVAIVANYSACRGDAEQLAQLEAWLVAQQRAASR